MNKIGPKGRRQWRIYIVKILDHPGSKFFQFHAVFWKIWQNRMLAPPPRENPGSATGRIQNLSVQIHHWILRS